MSKEKGTMMGEVVSKERKLTYEVWKNKTEYVSK